MGDLPALPQNWNDEFLRNSKPDKLAILLNPAAQMTLNTSVKSVLQALDSRSPTVGTLQRCQGRSFAEGVLMAWLAYLNNVLDVKRPLNAEQIELAAGLINEQYYMLKLSDLSLLFQKAITGEYGQLYESLDIPKVLSWFSQYFNERCEAAQTQTAQAHSHFVKGMESLNYSKNLKRRFKG